jgi:hypothetical protein
MGTGKKVLLWSLAIFGAFILIFVAVCVAGACPQQ